MNRSQEPYHHGDLRRALLDEAMALVEREGDLAMSLRACTRALGVDVAAAYRHFKNKGELLGAVAAEAMVQLGAQIVDALDALPEPRRDDAMERFVTCGESYVSFGLAHPHLYRLLFGGRCPLQTIQAQHEAHAQHEAPTPRALLSMALDDLMAQGHLPAASRPQADLFAWSTVHGMVSLAIEGRAELDPSMVEHCCRMVVRGLGAASTAS